MGTFNSSHLKTALIFLTLMSLIACSSNTPTPSAGSSAANIPVISPANQASADAAAAAADAAAAQAAAAAAQAEAAAAQAAAGVSPTPSASTTGSP